MATVGAFAFGAWVLLKSVPYTAATTLSDSTDTLFGMFPSLIELVMTVMIISLVMGLFASIFKLGPFKG